MNTEQAAFTALRSLISLGGIWILACWLYRDYRVDLFRQRTFTLRDELFDYAAKGMIAFDHPAYGMLRSTMNGFIRFGHQLGFLQFFWAIITARENNPRLVGWISFAKQWAEATKDLSPTIRNDLNIYLVRMNTLALQHIFFGSIATMLTVVLPLLFLIVAQNVLEKFRSPLDNIDATALVIGQA